MISESCAVSVIDLLETSASTPSPVGTASRVLIIADTDPRLGAALGPVPGLRSSCGRDLRSRRSRAKTSN